MLWDLSGDHGLPFTVPFHTSAHDGRLWIAPSYSVHAGQPEWEELHIKGTNWAGAQSEGCPHQLWYYNVSEYVDYLVTNQFNFVRLPLNGAIVLRQSSVAFDDWVCGPGYEGWEVLDILDDVIRQLQAAGIFVMLDLHSISHPEGNNGSPFDEMWDDKTGGRTSHTSDDVWAKLTVRYCKFPGVIMADVFNEPYYTSWADWRTYVQRVGNQILNACPRWLIVAEGIGDMNDGACKDLGMGGCWWGENVINQIRYPIRLSVPHRLVLSPHAYGHGNQDYMRARNFPDNMPAVWHKYWGQIPSSTGVPIVLGEWGGVWVDSRPFGRFVKSTAAWQLKMRDYLRHNDIGFFCALLTFSYCA